MNSDLKSSALNFAIQHLEHLNPDQFELFYQRCKSIKIDSKDQKIESLSQAEDLSLAVRVIRDHRMGFAYTTSLEPRAIQKAMDSAFEIAKYMPEDQNVGLFSFGSAVYPDVDQLDTRGLELPLAHKVELARKLEKECRKADSRIVGIRAASISEALVEVHMVDSHGEHIQHKSSSYSANITCKAEFQGDSQMGGEFAFSHYLDTLPIEATAKLAAHSATELLGSGAAPTLHCPAVLRNSVVAELLDFLSSSFSAEQIEKGRSILAGKQKQAVFSDRITIIDDGLLPGGAGTSPFDAEGVPAKKIVLVDGGFFTSVLCDFYHSKKLKIQPSGCSQRGTKSPPTIGFSNLYIEAGRTPVPSLYDGISKGVLITHLMGVHTANPVTGDFSLGASGILIENGQLTRPIRGFAVAGNVLGLFKEVTDIGNDLKFFGNIGAPSIRIGEISVGGQ